MGLDDLYSFFISKTLFTLKDSNNLGEFARYMQQQIIVKKSIFKKVSKNGA